MLGSDSWGSGDLMGLCGDNCKGFFFVTHYAAVVAAVMEDGTEITHLVTSPGLPLWMAHGLLSYEAAASTPQPNWMAPDEDEDDGDA